MNARPYGGPVAIVGPVEGFCSGTASAFVLFFATHFGIPISTTHVISGSIMGVGAFENAGKVRWITARKIVWAQLLTIPLTALCSALAYYSYSLLFLFHK